MFRDLARYMPDAEREALLEKLRRSIHADSDERDMMLHREVGEEERQQRIEKDMADMSLFARFILWVRSKFGGKSVRESFLTMRMKMLRRSIQNQYPGITGFETRDLNPKLAEDIFQIFALAIPLKPYFQKVWTDPLDLQNMIISVLESRISGVKRTLAEIVSLDRLEEIVAATDSREALREEASTRLNEYIDSIPNKVFSTTQADLKPLERTRDIILFPYASFFQQFHFTPLEDDVSRKTFFKSASAMLCLEHLEELHYALYSVTTIGEHFALADDLNAYLQIAGRAVDESLASTTTETNDESDMTIAKPEAIASAYLETDDEEELVDVEPEIVPETAQQPLVAVKVDSVVRNRLAKLVECCHGVYKRLPIESLVRFFLKDPYHDLVQTFNETSIKDLYASVLRLRILAELDKLHPELRKRVVEKEIQELFAGKTLRTFRNYREYQSIDYEKLGLPFFAHTRSVLLLFNYVQLFYKGYLQEIVQLVDKNVLGQNRITHDRLVQYAESVEDTAERIRQFDYSLSSDSEDGRTFQRLRFTLAQDASHQKMYRSLVLQKDREVRNIVERGSEALAGLNRVFQDLLKSGSPNIQASMQNHYFINGTPVSLVGIVQERVRHIQKFTRLLGQVINLERG